MKFRKFGSLGWEVSILGLGIHGLQGISKNPTEPEVEQSIGLIQYAINHGISYLDMGYPYQQDKQDSLRKLVKYSLDGEYRENIKIAATLPIDILASSSDVDRFIKEEFEKSGLDKIDHFAIGRLTRDNLPRLSELKVLDLLEKTVSQGLVDHIGFSLHDHFQWLKKVIDQYDNWSFCQFQYSYMDVDHDPGISGIKYAADKGLAVVVTEPLRGGRLTNIRCESVLKLWEQAPQKKSHTEWGLNFAWNDPGVSVVVSSIDSTEQLDHFLSIAESASPDSISIRDELLINRVRDAYHELKEIPCSSCRPCMPCPEEIDVPRIFEIYNDSLIYNDLENAQQIYIDERHNGEDCTECGLCSQRCAKEMDVVGLLSKAVQQLGRLK